jgi:hypothetical protein
MGCRRFTILTVSVLLVLAAAAPGARIVLRQFLTRYRVPSGVAARLVRDPGLETRLANEDRTFAYEFLIAEVNDARVR